MPLKKSSYLNLKSRAKAIPAASSEKTLAWLFIFLFLTICISLKGSTSVEAPRANKLLFEESINEKSFTSALEELPDYLKTGNIFDEEAVSKKFEELQRESHIEEVPAWAYGIWRSDKQIQDYARIYGEGVINEKVELPVQIFDTIGDIVTNDKKIYSIVSPGSINKLSRSDNLNEYQISLYEDRKVGFGYFTCTDKSIRLQVETGSSKIVKAYIVESVKVYRPVPGSQNLYTEAWLKSFDENGKPFIFSHSSAIKQLVERHKLLDLNEMQLGKASN